jgi:hypothetical protein
MDLAIRWHRILRALSFFLGCVVASVTLIFIFSNVGSVDVHWTIPGNSGPILQWTIGGVSLWLIAVVPTLAGLVLGYLYQTPARMHHVREHFRHRSRVHELEHELKELRSGLDRVLMMPEEGSLAVPAALMPPKVAEVSLPEEPSAADLLDDFPDPEAPAPPVATPPVAPAPAKPNRKKTVTLPSVPDTVAARPRRAGKTAGNGAPRPAARRSRPAKSGGKN